MWYVVQTVGGQEKHVLDLIYKLVDEELIQECFIPQYEVKKTYPGRVDHMHRGAAARLYIRDHRTSWEAARGAAKRPEVHQTFGQQRCVHPS